MDDFGDSMETYAYCGECGDFFPHWVAEEDGVMFCTECGADTAVEWGNPAIVDEEFELWEVDGDGF